MILTAPIASYANNTNFLKLPVKALEFKDENWSDELYYSDKYKKIWHLSQPIVSNGTKLKFGGMFPEVLSMSLASACRQVRIKDFYYKSITKPLNKKELKKIIKEKVERIKDQFPNTFALENTNYYPYPAYDHITEPDFIRSVIEDNNIGFVFDIAHAIVSANNLKIHPMRYVSDLPLESCVEVHLSTPGIVGGLWRDLHEAPNKDILDCFASVQDRLDEDVFVVVEYYRDFEVVCGVYNELERRFC